jgi:hypothetical protein
VIRILPATGVTGSRYRFAFRVRNCGRALPDFDGALKTPLDFLRNPENLWDSPRLEDKRAVLKLAFTGRLGLTREMRSLKLPI